MKFPQQPGTVLCRIPGPQPLWGIFSCPEKIIRADSLSEVQDALCAAEAASSDGKFLAGFISYETSPAFDQANRTKPLNDFPLIWFGVYAGYEEHEGPPVSDKKSSGLDLTPELAEKKYFSAIKKIKGYIAEGDIYQANYTFRSYCQAGKISPGEMFLQLTSVHPAPYSAYIDAGDFQVLSLSPELFLERSGNQLRSRPMKGTAPRRPELAADRAAARELAACSKNRAENVMIVDMVRNDFGRICVPGSIKVDPLFHVETYRSVHQMVSEIHGGLPDGTGFREILKANFPAPSITGAPKIRAMEIISELESRPRKIYTGSIGCLFPDGDFVFNVAIRTLIRESGKLELGVGGGIVADSQPESEWKEALLKTHFAAKRYPEFEILETILWERGKGFFLLPEHLERARNSQEYFCRKWDEAETERVFSEFAPLENTAFLRVRMLVGPKGKIKLESCRLGQTGWGKEILKVRISEQATDPRDPFLYHKTTNRASYNREFKQALAEGFDEVIFLNNRGEVTEGAISNIFVKLNGEWVTPLVSCGLLPGIRRRMALKELNAREQVLVPENLKEAEELVLTNSVRGQGKACIGKQ